MGDVIDRATGLDLFGTRSSQNAMDAQSAAAAQANATQRYMYDQNRTDMQPWREAGVRALAGLENPELSRSFTAEDFKTDPGYDFRMAEGAKAIERSAAAKGGLQSGATLKALERYSQDYASSEYDKAYSRFTGDQATRFGRLSAIAGIGQTANAQNAELGQNYANNVSQNQIGVGNAQAAAYIGNANRQANMVGQGASAAALFFSDRRLKMDITPVSKEDLAELRSVVKPFYYNYIEDFYGEGDWVGVMAQDLEKTRIGKNLVHTTKEGRKTIDIRKVASLMLATLVEA